MASVGGMKAMPLIFALALACAPAVARAMESLPEAPSGWVRVTPEPMRIGGREIDPTCSGAPGADPAYRFWARRGSVNRLVVYFDGGGACWDDITCSVPRLANGRSDDDGFYKAELIPGDDPTRLNGIFDFGDPRNPVRDWSFVFVPYCTGDIHSGSNTARYTDPDTGETFTLQHRGADNFRVVLAWMRRNFEAPDQILVAGSSAGAYGAATHYARIRAAFPRAHAAMLGDAGQGVTTPDVVQRQNEAWRFDLPRSVFGSVRRTGQEDVVARLAEHFPRDRFAQYTTAHDQTQTAFYALMGVDGACGAWTERMTHDLARRESLANFRAYVAAGNSHTILRTPSFYTQRSGGEPFSEWLAAMLSPDDGNWSNRACESCLAPPPPPTTCSF